GSRSLEGILPVHRESCKQLTDFILTAPNNSKRLGCTPLVLGFLILKCLDENGHGLEGRRPARYCSVQRASPFHSRNHPATESLLNSIAGPRGSKTLD